MSSGRPPAAIAVIRVSGPAAMTVSRALVGSLPAPRRAALRSLRDDQGDLLDRALVLVFPGPKTATGEDVVELHCHGGRAVVDAVERVLLRRPGLRRAEPGEFTRRALANGRIDLAEAEGLADLLEAETETQRRGALAAAEGRVSRAVRQWMDRLADLSARVEASIDYAEEGDLDREDLLLAGVMADRDALAAEMAAVLATPPVERWRDGIRVVVAGPPNAGKSTMVNALADRDAAIVSPIAGTTRDRVEVPVTRRGAAYLLVDTAGLRDDTDDPIEIAGMARARQAMESSDLLLWLGDGEAPTGALVVHAKADLGGVPDPRAVIAASALDPSSVDRLWELIEARTSEALPGSGLFLVHRIWVACDVACRSMMTDGKDAVLLAEALRVAHRSLASALGIDATEAMLNALFSRFCVGK